MISYIILFVLSIPVLMWTYGWYSRSHLRHIKTGEIIPSESFWLFVWHLIYGTKPFNYYVAETFKDVDIFGLYILNMFFIEVATPEMVKKFLNDDLHFEKTNQASTSNLDRFIGTEQVVNANGMDWKRHRAVVDLGFKDLNVYLKGFMEKAKITVDLVEGKHIEDWSDYTQKMALDILGKSLFGHEFDSLKDSDSVDLVSYNSLIHDLMSGPGTLMDLFLHRFEFLPRNQKISKDLKNIDRLFERLVETSKKKLSSNTPGELTMLDFMVDAMISPDKELSVKEVRDNFGVFFLAGHETTSNALAFAVYFLAYYQDMQENIRKEIHEKLGNKEITMDSLKDLEYLNSFLKESMRLFPPIAIVPPRLCVKEVELGGYMIKPGDKVLVNIVALHHSKKVYNDPEVFRPERWMDEKNKIPLYAWCPFSLGPRICVGMNFSMVEQKVFMIELLKRCRVRFVNKKPVAGDPSKGLLQAPAKNTIVFEKL